MSLLHTIAKKVGLSEDEIEAAEMDELTPEERALLDDPATLNPDASEEDDMPLTDEQTAALESVPGIESQVTELVKEDGRIASLESKLDTLLERLPAKEASDDEKREDLQKSVEKLTADLVKAQEDLDALAEGSTSQRKEDPDPLQKSDNPLVGILDD